MPALVIGLMVSKLLKKFSDNFYVQSAIWALKPTSCALLSAVAIQMFKSNLLSSPHKLYALIFFLILLCVSIFKKKDPLWYITVSAVVGIIIV